MMKEVLRIHIMVWCNLVNFQIINHLVRYIAGAKYELPKYVLSEPTNLIRDG